MPLSHFMLKVALQGVIDMRSIELLQKALLPVVAGLRVQVVQAQNAQLSRMRAALAASGR
jgi:uncharacterized protein (DUF305 family)